MRYSFNRFIRIHSKELSQTSENVQRHQEREIGEGTFLLWTKYISDIERPWYIYIYTCIFIPRFSSTLLNHTVYHFFAVFSLSFNSWILHSASDIGNAHNGILFTATVTPLTWHAPFKYVVSPCALETWSLDTNKSGYCDNMKVRYTTLQFFLFYMWVYTKNGAPTH